MYHRTGLAALLALATALSTPGVLFAQDTTATPEAAAQAEPAADGSKNRFYRGLATGITFYTQIAQSGGWPQVPEGGTLSVGVDDPRVPILRQRLYITGDYLGEDTQSTMFDAALKEAVVAFQNRNGQEPDGAVGPATLASMNVPVEKRLEQLRINQRRWDNMPASLGDRFVLVNMAGFELEVIEGEKTVLDMKVVVGKDYHSTPEFSDLIKTIEINPYWNVPASIANKELKLDYMKGAATLAKADSQGYEVVNGDQVVPVSQIAWTKYKDDNLPFRIRQRPGPSNALGDMKFLFPNKHNVYLHDTQAKSLFSKTVRAFSHGCVRLHRPRELAEYLLAANGWDRAKIDEVVASGERTRVKLEQPTPVHLAYMTAWLGRQGFIQFRPDIYGRDAEDAQQLAPPPSDDFNSGTDPFPVNAPSVLEQVDPQAPIDNSVEVAPLPPLAGTEPTLNGDVLEEAETRATPPPIGGEALAPLEGEALPEIRIVPREIQAN
ncbi:murein L,D-transpeptidase [Ahrensia sp. R2A130]|uniref:L,D-transpeptidase family protein n=1 Tax=Ahrensia sp. R2A130 TaxID=744979 RepID=UPI0001E0F88D|nr:L,D-transpeptidase family protein [Ahrensia sp. R2A130]EFL89218.1 peptidoglycan binding domain-containing protein [Ahrensia sp. R2A130]